MRHSLLTVPSPAVTGVLAGCRSLTAIWEHITDLTAADLEAVGLRVGQALASESTIRRVLQDLASMDLDTHVRPLVLYAYRHHRRPQSHRNGQ